MFEKSLKDHQKLLGEEKGATMVEYALLAALIGVAGIGAVTNLGERTWASFNETGKAIEASTGVLDPDDVLIR